MRKQCARITTPNAPGRTTILRQPTMPQDANHLIWIDMEMTGLKPETDRIIEVALVITDGSLATVAEAPVLVVHQDDVTLSGMDSWNQATHGRTGLTDRVRASKLDEADAEQQLLGFLREAVKEYGQTIVMVTHDAGAAGYADRVVFLADGLIVDEMREPTAASVLDRLKSLEG